MLSPSAGVLIRHLHKPSWVIGFGEQPVEVETDQRGAGIDHSAATESVISAQRALRHGPGSIFRVSYPHSHHIETYRQPTRVRKVHTHMFDPLTTPGKRPQNPLHRIEWPKIFRNADLHMDQVHNRSLQHLECYRKVFHWPEYAAVRTGCPKAVPEVGGIPNGPG